MKAHWLIRFALLFAVAVAGAQADDEEPNVAATSTAHGPAAANDEHLQAIIEKVRAAEQRYRNLEYLLRIAPQDESKPAAGESRLNASANEETHYAIHQGDLFLFKRRQVRTISGQQTLTEQIAAFDGETTRSVIFDNCVTVYARRHEPSQLYPPHTWGMYALSVNFPLSVYLQGPEAITRHAYPFKRSLYGMEGLEIGKVKTTVEGNDIIDGMECIRLRCRRLFAGNARPLTELIWLMPERNYLCAKATSSSGEGAEMVPNHETRVTAWAEPAPGLWLPKRVEMTFFKGRGPWKPTDVWRRETLTLEKVAVNPKYLISQFKKIEVPPDLPVYRIDREGFLEGSGVKSARLAPADRSEVDRIVAEIRRAEQQFDRFDVSLTTSNWAVAALRLQGYVSPDEIERTIFVPGKLYSEREQRKHRVAMADDVSAEKRAWDGKWVRILYWDRNQGDSPLEPSRASLHKGGPKGLDAFRPHTALFDDWRMRRRPLSDFLTAEYWDERNKYRYLVESLGEEVVAGLECEKLRLGLLTGGSTEPTDGFFFLWLAKERNYLPVRAEHVDLSVSDRLPTAVYYVDDLRELRPGLWFPFHITHLSHEHNGLESGQIVLNYRQERHVQNVDLEPDPSNTLFTPVVPAGTIISVNDETPQQLGQFRQKQDGVPVVDEEKLLTMAETARVNEEEQKRRQAAMDALIGAPLPEIPEATWLNSPPLSNASLNGKVLLIVFWAEWCGPSGRLDLQKLGKVDQDLAADGVTLVGVHTAGSERADVENAVSEFGLDYPIYIDTTDQGGTFRWGKLFEKFAVRELPHAFVVDRQGKIVAHGRLDQMLSQARALAAKK
jgi:thiol-disulfide isomerase/thioredoxin